MMTSHLFLSASSVIVLFELLTTVDGLNCLQCDSISHPRFCQVVASCKTGEVCYAKTVEATDGYKSYSLGCTADRTLAVCNATYTNDRYHCLECCSADLCNAALCGEKGYPDPRGPICYSCKSRLLGEPCNALEYCGIDEVCSISNTVIFSETVYSSGCSQQHICEAHNHGSGPHIVGRRAVNNPNLESGDDLLMGRVNEDELPPELVSEDDLSPGNCHRCCQTDLCNDNCSASAVDVRPCSSSPCLHGGLCVDTTTDFSCICPSDYTGKACATHVRPCSSSPCLNGGLCVDTTTDFSCICPSDYTGKACATHRNACSSSPCQHGGTCMQDGNSFFCSCHHGFSGQSCQTAVDACTSTPCHNRGVCVSNGTGYSCLCKRDSAYIYSGVNCELVTDICASCKNNASCIDFGRGFKCMCRYGFTGMFCDTSIDECTSSPCMNNATCVDMVGGYSCACPAGYSGQHCEINVDDCVSLPCLHNGRCVDMVSGYECACPAGYGGKHCNLGPARDCLDVQHMGLGNTSGVYTVLTHISNTSLRVLCDMTTDGGGWTVIQYRFNGSVDFYRNFSEYEHGFGNVYGEHWLGLLYIYELGRCASTTLRLELENSKGLTAYETFSDFSLTSHPYYTLQISPNTGTAGDGSGLSYSNGYRFSTYDRDRDTCAKKDHGGWWYNICAHANLNGLYVQPPGTVDPERGERGMIYRSFDAERSLKSTKMLLRRGHVDRC